LLCNSSFLLNDLLNVMIKIQNFGLDNIRLMRIENILAEPGKNQPECIRRFKD